MSVIDEIGLNGACVALDGTLTNVYDQTPLADQGTGTGFGEDAIYPFPRVHHRASPVQQAQRDNEIAQAKLDNPFNDTVLPGAVVHGNMASPNIRHNSTWRLHGDKETRRQFAKEDKLGEDDSSPGEDATDVYESLFHYLEKNCDLWLTSQDIQARLSQLSAYVSSLVIDQMETPFIFRLNLTQPVIELAPSAKARKVEHLDFYPEKFPERYQKQPFDAEFDNDDVIAWTQVAYASPFFRLEPYKQHLPNFAVTNNIFRQTNAFKNDDLDQAMADGRVFVVDFKEFNDLNLRTTSPESVGARLFTPIGMFAVPKGSDQLKTIAIQCTQDTPQTDAELQAWRESNTQSADRPLSEVMCPTDDYWSWQMAKTVFMSMYAMSSVIDHLSMHVYSGPIPVSFYRNIPRQHPLTALLEPHFMTLVSNNYVGIFYDASNQDTTAYGPPDKGLLTGAIPKVAAWTGQTFIDAAVQLAGRYDFKGHSTPRDRSDYAAIGDMPILDDQGSMPIIKRWTNNYLGLYYRNDADVQQDFELQSFCSETASEGKVAGFPASISTREELADMTARIIYWMSVNHTLEATLGCTKLAPLSYWSDRVPRKNETKTESDWLNALPPINLGLATFCASRLFIDLPRDWYRSLGRFPEGQFMQDRRVYKHLETFQNELLDLDDQIQETNTTRRWKYTMMRPATMTCSPWN